MSVVGRSIAPAAETCYTLHMERLNPLNDFLFLKTMGEEGAEEPCLGFLNAVFEDTNRKEPVKLVKILENHAISPEIMGDKGSVLDVRALTDKNERVNIEVQLKDLHNMSERTLYYWAREYVDSIKEGQDYADLPRVVTINIVDFNHVKLEHFHSAFRLREDRCLDYILTDVLEIHFLNMVQFRKLKEAGNVTQNALARWMLFFDERTPEKELLEVIKMDRAIERAQSRMDEATRSSDFMHQYTLRQIARMDWQSGINTAFKEGTQQGLQQGIQQGVQQGANRVISLLQQGWTIEQVEKHLVETKMP